MLNKIIKLLNKIQASDKRNRTHKVLQKALLFAGFVHLVGDVFGWSAGLAKVGFSYKDIILYWILIESVVHIKIGLRKIHDKLDELIKIEKKK